MLKESRATFMISKDYQPQKPTLPTIPSYAIHKPSKYDNDETISQSMLQSMLELTTTTAVKFVKSSPTEFCIHRTTTTVL